jgi:hypothetical protein
MSLTAHDRQVRRTRRRQAGFLALVLGSVALVEAKAVTAPPTHKLNLGGSAAPAVVPTPAGHARSPGATGGSATTAPARSVNGQPIDIGYGIVQVQLTVQRGRITDVRTLQAPSGGRSGSIASYAIPQLRSEVLAAQSTTIDTVSGASYTSEGYARSVQSALDAARA